MASLAFVSLGRLEPLLEPQELPEDQPGLWLQIHNNRKYESVVQARIDLKPIFWRSESHWAHIVKYRLESVPARVQAPPEL